MLLLTDSTSQQLFVALISPDGIVTQRVCDIQRAHDRNINKLTAGLIERADAFAVVTGPGSWTGSRVGVVAVKAYALATGKPVIALHAAKSREELVAEARRKYKAGEFTSARDLVPHYDAEFKVTLKK